MGNFAMKEKIFKDREMPYPFEVDGRLYIIYLFNLIALNYLN